MVTKLKSKLRKKKKAGRKQEDRCMGGINENLVPKNEPTVAEGTTPEKVRVHIDTTTGEVHFHDQNVTPRRTVAVPVSVWYRIWQELQTLQRVNWEYLDMENGNLLSFVVHNNNTHDLFELDMTIKPVNVNETFKTLAKVSKRQAPGR